MKHAQSIPCEGPMCLEWPRYLASLLARKSPLPAHEWSSTVINAKSGYARTNRSTTVEHLLQSHASTPTRRGLTLTFLYTSRKPGLPANALWAGAGALTAQHALAKGLHAYGLVSGTVFTILAMGTALSVTAGLVLHTQNQKTLESARLVPAHQREVVCITSGNGSSDAVVVVTEAGGVKLEDVAAGRVHGLGWIATGVVGALLVLWGGLLCAIAQLDVADAWCVLGLAVIGTAYTAYGARRWCSPAELGFKFDDMRKVVVHEDKVMDALMQAEEVESGVGVALLPVFFPGQLRSTEEEYWGARKAAPKGV